MGNEIATLEHQFAPLVPHFADVLGNVMKPERLIRTVLVSVERAPKLLSCNRQSLFNAAMSAAVLGLEVDGVTGQAFLIPFGDRAQLVIGYKGFNTLAARAGMTITGEVVREGDEFEYDIGEGWVTHKPSLAPASSRRIIAAWAKAAAQGRPPIIAVMGIADIEAVKARSPGAKKSDSPWNDPVIGFPAMASKTVKRRLARSTPLSVFQLAAALDEAVEERGQHAYIGRDDRLHIEGEALSERQPNRTPTMKELTSAAPPVAAEKAGEATSPPLEPDGLPGDAVPSLLDTARAEARKGRSAFKLWFSKLDDDDQARVDAITGEIKELWKQAAEPSS